jgi:hypothetical protein
MTQKVVYLKCPIRCFNLLDSYWNSETGEAFFDDTSRTAVAARQALDDLFVPLNNEVVSIADSDHLNSESEFENCRLTQSISNDFVRPFTTNINSNHHEDKINSIPPEKSTRLGSVSVLSDCSVGSFATESTSNYDYGRIKAELRQLQRDYKVDRSFFSISKTFRGPKKTDSKHCPSKKPLVVLDRAKTFLWTSTSLNNKN